jgi:hypothetical protein
MTAHGPPCDSGIVARLRTLVILLTCGCSSLTQLVVVVDTDYSVPDDLGRFELSVSGVATTPANATADLRTDSTLPRYISLVHRGGPTGPVTVTVEGFHNGAAIVRRSANVSFVLGQTRMLRLELLRSCEPLFTSCAAPQTCAAGRCGTADIAADDLLPWTGPPGRLIDAGPMDAGGMDAGSDAGVREDAGMMMTDAGRDAGRDGGTDAGRPPCDTTFGSATMYMLCAQTATTCEIALSSPAARSCTDICTSFGRTCSGQWDNNATAVNCTHVTMESCAITHQTSICICSR